MKKKYVQRPDIFVRSIGMAVFLSGQAKRLKTQPTVSACCVFAVRYETRSRTQLKSTGSSY